MNKTGGYLSLICSFCHLLTGILILLQPALFVDDKVDYFLNTAAEDPTLFILFFLFTALTAIFSIGTIEPITSFLKVQDIGFVKWTQKLAYLGFAVLSIAYFRVITIKPDMAAFYTTATEQQKDIVRTMDPYISFSANGIIIYGFVGFWIFFICILSLCRQKNMKLHYVLGFILGIVMILSGIPFISSFIFAILSVLRGILSSLWFGVIGYILIKNDKSERKSNGYID